MASFSAAIETLLNIEGQYVNDENDNGGETKWGISKARYPHIDISSLTKEVAITIYKRDYWDLYKLDSIRDITIATQIFLLFVNMNPRNAALIVQRAINFCDGVLIQVKEDGVLGSKTLEAINFIPYRMLSDKIRIVAIMYYLAITDKNKSQIKFFRGWVRRALL